VNSPRPDIRLTILGSGTCVPSLSRSACAVRVEAGGHTLLIDSGPGTMRRLLEAGTTIFELSHLLYSHLHPDHTAELVPLLFATKYPAGEGRSTPLMVVAGRGFRDFFERLRQAYGGWIDIGSDRFRVVEMDTRGRDGLDLGGVRVQTAPVEHNPESIAFRLTVPGGKSMVYSGDTDHSEALVDLARDTDLLVCESAFPESHKVRGHLTPAQAGEIARRAGARRLVLTHFYPQCEAADIAAECRRAWAGPLTLAEDLMVIEL
jgi:ribonuclease BN (tRNA processing enzyme)